MNSNKRNGLPPKKLEIFTPGKPLSERADRRRPASPPPQQRSEEPFATELPEDMGPAEAEQRFSEMEAQIREMRRRL